LWSWLVFLVYVLVPITMAVVVTHSSPGVLSGRTPADAGLPYRDVDVQTSDGVQLSGWYIPSRNGAAVLTIPGGGETRDGIFDQAVVVARNGYGVLDLDTRGHGPSQGTPMDFGWFGDLDVAAGISFLSAQEEVDPSRITALGLSMGGEEALTAAATDPRLRASGSRITLRALPIVARLREMGARPASPRSRARRQTGTDLPPALQALSPRERDIVGLVVQGCTNREIAERLVISERTAETHIQRVLNRLGWRSRRQVAAWAVHHGKDFSAVPPNGRVS
jgi:DNA-binding CsgD family transcriptional regulator